MSVLDDRGDIAPADLGDISAIAAPPLDHANGIAVAILSGDRGVPGAELGNAYDVVTAALIAVGKVGGAVLTDYAFVVGTLLRVDLADSRG